MIALTRCCAAAHRKSHGKSGVVDHTCCPRPAHANRRPRPTLKAGRMAGHMAGSPGKPSREEGLALEGQPRSLLSRSVGRFGFGASLKPLDNLVQPPDRRTVSVST